ncbi:MAG: sensor histidine kinase [Gammaproteobacteria bacterium]|nr:sensor histidine kinase [Gammaproteobacteria bacterium]
MATNPQSLAHWRLNAVAARSSPALSYLPDFSSAAAVTALVVISQLVALALTLAAPSGGRGFFVELARHSLLMLWMALASACVLTALRPVLARQTTAIATAYAIGLVLTTIALLSEAIFAFGERFAQSRLLESMAFFPATRWEFLARNLALGALITVGALRYFYVAHQWRSQIERQAESRIAALQARIRPHFFFNSMNTIAALTRSDPAAAEHAVEDLADLFRASLANPDAPVSLGDEIELAQVYQRMEEQRLGARLHVDWQLDELPLATRIPGLTIQPLLENAIYHGIEPRHEGGTVTVAGALEGDMLTITVTNPLPAIPAARESGHQLALNNIRERLELAYGGRARLEVTHTDDRYSILIGFPLGAGGHG